MAMIVETNLRESLTQFSNEIKKILEQQVGSIPISDPWMEGYTPSPGDKWENYRWVGERFRYGHVEQYFADGLLVVHITVFPKKDDAMPIFGMDIIGSEKTGKISGFFLDYSPTIIHIPFGEDRWKSNRKLPNWGTVFSKDFIAIRPEGSDHSQLFQTGKSLFQNYMDLLNRNIYGTKSPTAIGEIIKAQNRYCEEQSKNERTLSALSKKVGKERAEKFMKEVLFPKIQAV